MNTATADVVRTCSRSHDRLRVVVAGGGVAGLEAVLTLAVRAREMLDVTLVANQDDFAFHARSVGAPFGLGRSYRLALRDIARHTGATFRRAWVTGVDSESRQLLLAGDERMSFDALLLALGARSLPVYPPSRPGATTTPMHSRGSSETSRTATRAPWRWSCHLDRCGPRRHTNSRCCSAAGRTGRGGTSRSRW